MYAGRKVEEASVRQILRRRRSIPTRRACSARCPSSARRQLARAGQHATGRNSRPRAEPQEQDHRLRLRRPLPASRPICAARSRRGWRRRHRGRWWPAITAEKAWRWFPHEHASRRTHSGGQRPQEALRHHWRAVLEPSLAMFSRSMVSRSQSRGRDAVAGRRERLRQIDRRQGDPAALLRSTSGQVVLERPADRRSFRRRAAPLAQAHAGGVSGPVFLAQSAHAGAGYSRRADHQFRAGIEQAPRSTSGSAS